MKFEGEEEDLVRARRFIEPASGFIKAQRKWRPHPQNQQVEYTKFSSGLDWESQIRYLEPTSGWWRTQRKHPLVPWPGTRPLPDSKKGSEEEWLYNPQNDLGLKTQIRGRHQASKQTTYTLHLEKAMGMKKSLLDLCEAADQRNFIPRKTGGDKPYLMPEYEQDFHKKGSTRPVPVFGQNVKGPGVVIPLVSSAGQICVPYFEKEAGRRQAIVVEEVAQLEKWRPATPLTVPGKDKEESGGPGGQTAQQAAQQKGK